MTGPRLRRGPGAVLTLWRRSVQLRVVGSTVVLSSLAIGLTGWALLHDVADGLATSRRQSAVVEARAGFDRAGERLAASIDLAAADPSRAIAETVDAAAGPGTADPQRQVLVVGPLGTPEGSAPVRSSGSVGLTAVPADLATRVRTSDGVFWRYAELSIVRPGEVDPAVVVGSRLRSPTTGDVYAVFYLFSLADQVDTLALVRNALLLGGLVMVLLVGGVAWLVSRQVLSPVRLARRIAERFAAGHLEQRMHVRGEDDIARLSMSFNQMAASLQTQIRRLENLSRLQQRFVSDVSHELRTPLTTVQMASAVLYDSRPRFDPPTARAAELLMLELDRFEELLSDLLDLSRFDAGAARLELETVDLAQVVRRIATDPVLDRKGITVRFVGTDEPAVVEADIRRVDRILRNLTGNAAKYSGSSDLLVRVGSNERCATVAIRDHGVGMEPRETLRVFDRFWRADPARAQGGTGLGLSIAREDAALHGGTLVVASQPGRGTEFLLTLPTPDGDASVPALESELA